MPPARRPPAADSISVVRTGLAALLVVAGIAWVAYYVFAVLDDGTPAWMADLGDWNFLIGFGAMFLGLIARRHTRAPRWAAAAGSSSGCSAASSSG